jgi:hypothetical protein
MDNLYRIFYLIYIITLNNKYKPEYKIKDLEQRIEINRDIDLHYWQVNGR